MIVGIDLGTTNSLIATYRNSQVELIPNQFGEYLTPSVVSIEKDGRAVVGKMAKEQLISASENSIAVFKRYMGSDQTFRVGEQAYTPEELSALVLQSLLRDAASYLEEEITEAVISVPAYFDSNQRAATKKAGELAGIKTEVLINEPSAAALANRRAGVDEAFMVIDFGGGTLDVSIVECFHNVINVCAVCGDNHLGGVDFDQLIAEYLCEQMQVAMESLTEQEQAQLVAKAEVLKLRLQVSETTEMSLLFRDQQHQLQLSNDWLAEKASYLFERVRQVIAKAVNDSYLDVEEISKCILVGGTTKMPVLQRYLQKILPVELAISQHSDQIVAEGLGIYTGIRMRCNETKQIVLTDICPYSLGLSIAGAKEDSKAIMSVIIPRNTALPVTKREEYCTTKLGQTSLTTAILQGEAYYAENNLQLGKIHVTVPFNPKAHEVMEVAYTYDINATLVVETKVLATGESHHYLLKDQELVEDDASVAETQAQIQQKAMILASYNSLDVLKARELRMFEESIEPVRSLLGKMMLETERLTQVTSLLRVNQVVNQHFKLLNQIEYGKAQYHFFKADTVENKIIDLEEKLHGNLGNPEH